MDTVDWERGKALKHAVTASEVAERIIEKVYSRRNGELSTFDKYVMSACAGLDLLTQAAAEIGLDISELDEIWSDLELLAT